MLGLLTSETFGTRFGFHLERPDWQSLFERDFGTSVFTQIICISEFVSLRRYSDKLWNESQRWKAERSGALAKNVKAWERLKKKRLSQSTEAFETCLF